jgi:Xaa-Pro aminopeptidase
MLTAILSRQRQKRLLALMEKRRYDVIVVGAPHHVYYFTAHWTGWQHLSAFLLFADGRSLLVTANAPNKSAAADEVIAYDANAMSTLRDDQAWTIGRLIVDTMRHRAVKRIGADASVVTSQVALGFDGPREAVDEELWQMRRVKDADELELMKKAVACCDAMYARAAEIIEPGISEIEVYAQLHEAAVFEAGEPLAPAYLGNDFACAAPGGPPRGDRAAKAGELYILDLGPGYRGYLSDNARTFAVNRKPTDAQFRAWEQVTGVFRIVEAMARPGVRCIDIFRAIDDYLKGSGGPGMTHHLGHGVGLSPHEYPHLNPEWDDVLQEGEIFTAEPGIYAPELNAGLRIENEYRVTATGVVNLVQAPLAMA